MTSLRRYAPFALLVATQMVLVLVAPSHGSGGGTKLGGQFQGGPAAQSGVPGAPGVNGSVAAVPGASGVPGATGTTTGAAGAGGTTVAAGGSGGLASGQTTSGKACITGLTEHLPCAPKWAGGDNGSATWPGVTATQITVVMYRPKDNAAVNAILQTTGTYTPPSAEQQMIGVVGDWINKHFQLYNRKIKFIWAQGTCDIAPPVDSCFRGDADNLVSQYHPFAVFWPSDTNESAFFDELSRKGVLNWGGWAFTDAFNNSLRPYHYDLFMGGDTQADITGRWICQRLANKSPRFAGDATLKAQPVRKFAVTYPNTATSTPSAKRLENIIKSCDKNHFVYDSPYSSDTSTAAQQATTNTAQTKSAGVTTVVWFSDLIAPAYGTKAQASQSYFPEEVIAGEGLLDYDALAQTYDQTEWAHAFGPSDIAEQAPINNSDAGLIWKQEGQSGSPNQNSNLMTSYMLSVAGGIMAAGPKLTPLTYEYGQLTQPGYDSWEQWHNPRLEYIKYGKGDYTGLSDVREVYYDPNKTSPTNNRPGAYVALNGGRRYQLNNIPSGEPSLPASV
jgi:hypothetical protein